MRISILLLISLVLVGVMIHESSSTALGSTGSLSNSAQETGPQVTGIMQYDLDGDGKPDKAEIRGNFITGNDLLVVYDPQNDMPSSSDWHAIIHFDHDILIFDAEGDGTSELVIYFQVQGDKYIALLYDDRDGDGQVSYQVAGKTIEITEVNETAKEPAYPTVRVEAAGPWLLPDGRSQGNITFSIDGFVPAQVSQYYAEVLNSFFTNDGKVDFEIQVVDSNMDGDPDYEVFRMLQPLPEYYEVFRTLIYKNEGESRMLPPEGFLFWPFLGHAAWYESLNYLDSPPTIDMDWIRGKINRAGIWGYPTEAGWHITSFLPLQEGQINDTNFETPMAYYDLAQNNDGFPELHVRVQYQVPYGAEALNTSYGIANEEIRYSWKQETSDNLSWDYKLGLFGRHPINSVVSFPDFQICTIPYKELPGWVVDNKWDAAMFVAREDRGYESSEGIYFGGPFNPEYRPYLLGESINPPTVTLESVVPGWRIEYNWDFSSRPILYLSSVDHKLHLKGAEQGFWRIYLSDSTIEYQSLGGEYMRMWSVREGGIETKQLYLANDFLIYFDAINDVIHIKAQKISPLIFETLPPTNHNEWLDLGQKLQDNSSAFTPGDLEAMYAQFEGPEISISGATLRDYRSISGGFRFVLELLPGFTISGPDWLGLQPQTPGNYVVSDNGILHLSDLTPPDLQVSFNPSRPSNELPTQFVSQMLQISLSNEGLEDAQQVLVSLGTSQTGSDITWTEPQTVTVLAGETIPMQFQWTPDTPGVWWIQVQTSLSDTEPNTSTVSNHVISVQPAQDTTIQEEISAFGVVAPWQVLLLMVSVVVTAGLAGWILIRRMGMEASSQHSTTSKLNIGPK